MRIRYILHAVSSGAAFFYMRRKDMEEKIAQFKAACREYFQKVSISCLRAYGRFLGLRKPTVQHKQALIEDIIKMLCGEMKPERNKQGAPVKERVDMGLVQEVERLKDRYLDGVSLLLPELQTAEEEEKAPAVMMQFRVNVTALNKEQKQKMYDFVMSL